MRLKDFLEAKEKDIKQIIKEFRKEYNLKEYDPNFNIGIGKNETIIVYTSKDLSDKNIPKNFQGKKVIIKKESIGVDTTN